MTHFVGLVVGPDIEGQLARFSENREVEPYRDYVPPAPEGWEIGEANLARFQSLLAEGIDRQVAWKQVWGEENTDPSLPWPRSHFFREHNVEPTDNAAVAAAANATWDSSAYLVDDGGLYEMSASNPEGYWDWYAIGGRWPDWMIRKDGSVVSSAPAGDVDWAKSAVEFWPSVVVAEGVWKSSKSWGWFGLSTDTIKPEDWAGWCERFFLPMGDVLVSVVDFHV